MSSARGEQRQAAEQMRRVTARVTNDPFDGAHRHTGMEHASSDSAEYADRRCMMHRQPGEISFAQQAIVLGQGSAKRVHGDAAHAHHGANFNGRKGL